MYALREGAIFFPGETVVKIVAPLAEAALLYNFLVDILCSNTVFATKAARVRIAAGDKGLGSGAIRGHAGEAMLKYMRSAYITGFDLMVAPVFGEKFAVDFPRLLKGTHHHFITSFSTEFDAMLAIAETFPRKEVTLILDTYSVETGLENAIEVAQILQQRNREYGIHSVFIDSGDLEAHARYVRERLDMAGLAEVKIVIASDLNEERLQALVRTGTPFDSCLLATELITSADEPKLDAVYKMAEIIEDGIARSTIKLAPGKKSFPGNKETYRQYDAEGKMRQDIIALENETIHGERLLVPVIERGELVKELPSLGEIRAYFLEQMALLPEELKRIDTQEIYPVRKSAGLKLLIQRLTREMSRQDDFSVR